ncbi:hypothetical protein C8Q80DRAFT_1275810 [Daedaleopsis nitida]|nr:hypothetical protein C8Q80DRAFT_1275810 [Daedaleopsis nitida]
MAEHHIPRDIFPPYKTSEVVRNAATAAACTTMNPRNIEAHHYAVYWMAFNDLLKSNVPFGETLHAMQQFPQALSKATLDVRHLTLKDIEDAYPLSLSSDEEEAGEAEEPVEGPGQEEDEDQADSDAPSSPLSQAGSDQQPVSGNAGRPRRLNVREPGRHYTDLIVSAEAREALEGPRGLTAQERERAIQNVVEREHTAQNPMDADVGDESFDTTATVQDGKGKDFIPDIIVSHLCTVQKPEPEEQAAKFAWNLRLGQKLRHYCFPLHMEIKCCPSRGYSGHEDFQDRCVKLLEQAEGELYQYLRMYFAVDRCAKEVIAVSAAGQYWRWIAVKRQQVEEYFGSDAALGGLYNKDSDDDAEEQFTEMFSAADINQIGTEDSDLELMELRQKLLTIVEQHKRYKSTAIPNPQP